MKTYFLQSIYAWLAQILVSSEVAIVTQELQVPAEAIGQLVLVKHPSTGMWQPGEVLDPSSLPLQRALTSVSALGTRKKVLRFVGSCTKVELRDLPQHPGPIMYELLICLPMNSHQ
jgi:hypothetical protein